MITASGHEIILIQCENEDDVATVQSILEARKQSQIDGGAFTPPLLSSGSPRRSAFQAATSCLSAMITLPT